jgi:hypothetical protein
MNLILKINVFNVVIIMLFAAFNYDASTSFLKMALASGAFLSNHPVIEPRTAWSDKWTTTVPTFLRDGGFHTGI